MAGSQILFVAFGALVLVPLLTGRNPSIALLGAGVGTLLFQLVTRREVASVGLKTLIRARVDLDQPRNLVIVSAVLVFGVGGPALNVAGFTLQGVSLWGIAAAVLNFLVPQPRTGG